MVKKKLKKFHFIKKNSIFEFEETNNLFDDLVAVGLATEGQILNHNMGNAFTINDGLTTTMIVGNGGNIFTQGQIRALGSVIFNIETRRLNYWDGNEWIEINQ